MCLLSSIPFPCVRGTHSESVRPCVGLCVIMSTRGVLTECALFMAFFSETIRDTDGLVLALVAVCKPVLSPPPPPPPPPPPFLGRSSLSSTPPAWLTSPRCCYCYTVGHGDCHTAWLCDFTVPSADLVPVSAPCVTNADSAGHHWKKKKRAALSVTAGLLNTLPSRLVPKILPFHLQSVNLNLTLNSEEAFWESTKWPDIFVLY